MRDATMQENIERVVREERAWAVARYHLESHHNWLPPDECPECLEEAETAKADEEVES